MPATMIIQMGDTPMSHISRADTIGIQMVHLFSSARLPRLNVGTAMRATTAGRMPRNIAATMGLSLNWLKNIAMARIIRNEGRAVPNAVAMAPRSFFNLYPMKMAILMAKPYTHLQSHQELPSQLNKDR